MQLQLFKAPFLHHVLEKSLCFNLFELLICSKDSLPWTEKYKMSFLSFIDFWPTKYNFNVSRIAKTHKVRFIICG